MATQSIDRRTFIRHAIGGGAALALAGSPGCGPGGGTPPPHDGWNAGDVDHLLPVANHERIRLKASFREPLAEAPRLVVGDRSVTGVRGDSAGRFYSFDVLGLEPATTYALRLVRQSGEPLCEQWPLRTFPHPDWDGDGGSFRLLLYTCAGGPDNLYNFGFFNAYVPMATRQRLFARALSFEPDAAIANGDHVYWDLKSSTGRVFGRSPAARFVAGRFDREQPILGTDNEQVLERAFGPQLAGLYGVMFRSLPCYFLQDDHDYGENDEASDALRTFPADAFMLDLARTTQRLYYPELLGGSGIPSRHLGPGAASESYGALRFGRLFEGLLYDCRRHLRNALDPLHKESSSGFVPPDVEAWLLRRSATSPCAHVAHVPSTPVLWSAGKWGEWYPDFQDAEGRLTPDATKPYWPRGWSEQHDRLVFGAAERADRTPIFMSGDLHATAIGRIHASHGRSLAPNPVVSVLTGAIGTGALGWPSKFRGQLPIPSGTLVAEEWVSPIEENGFSIAEFSREGVEIALFRWSPEMGEDAIDELQPFEIVNLPRPSS